jgi:hypothetical protein
MLAAPMDWWDWLVASVLKVRNNGEVMLAAPTLIGMLMTTHWAEVSRN